MECAFRIFRTCPRACPSGNFKASTAFQYFEPTEYCRFFKAVCRPFSKGISGAPAGLFSIFSCEGV
ncbi:MAG: hypothetical protein DBX55_01090 [Verrucomicrobia bacterium]|nr:MAG: hypothetical protein DBX55_01090 [Verrucomicrobiota bacterium]